MVRNMAGVRESGARERVSSIGVASVYERDSGSSIYVSVYVSSIRVRLFECDSDVICFK